MTKFDFHRYRPDDTKPKHQRKNTGCDGCRRNSGHDSQQEMFGDAVNNRSIDN
jgi:hypothetical protein